MEDSTVIGAFGEEDAARLSGLSVWQLREWDRSGFLRPSYAPDNRQLPHSRVYSFRDIVALRVLGQLRNTHHVSLQHLKKVSQKLAEFGDAKWTSTTLYVLGRKVVFDDPRSKERKEVLSGQRVFDIPLRIAAADTRKAIRLLNKRDPGDAGKIVSDRFVMENQPVFNKTRIPVAVVKRYLAAGYSTDGIIKEFPSLSVADIEAAATYEVDISAA